MTKLRISGLCSAFLFCFGFGTASPAQSTFFSALTSFDGANGSLPGFGALTQAADGSFYGTTVRGGAYGDGTVFRVTAGGVLDVLYSFCTEANCSDGSAPWAGLVQGSDGNLYGTTSSGGSYNDGTFYKISPSSGVLTTLHSFDGPHGANPMLGLLQAPDGNFYGTTGGGGTNADGTVYKMTPSGAVTVLHSFSGADGSAPTGLLLARDGNFYGTTAAGGTSRECGDGCGTVFKITPIGTLTTLYSFGSLPNWADGNDPLGGLVQASDGNFYGTTLYGGANEVSGTVYKITPTGTFTNLHSFNYTDGNWVYAGLIQANDGYLYGTTYEGAISYGTIFRITLTGVLTTLHAFDFADGGMPGAPPVQSLDGAFYGTTYQGGAYGIGTIYRLGQLRPCLTCRP